MWKRLNTGGNRIGHAAGDKVAGEGSPVTIGGGGDGLKAGESRGANAEDLVVQEEEGLVAAAVELGSVDGAADGTASIMLAAGGADVGEGAVGVEGFIGEVLISGAVGGVGAGAADGVEETPATWPNSAA